MGSVSKIIATADLVAVQILGIAGVVTTTLYPVYGHRSWFIALPGTISGLAAFFSRNTAKTG